MHKDKGVITPEYPNVRTELEALRRENARLKKTIEYLNRQHGRVLDELARHSKAQGDLLITCKGLLSDLPITPLRPTENR